MARKPSVIMNAADRKEAKNNLKDEIKQIKDTISEREHYLKSIEKLLTADRKTLLGLQTRLDALKEAK